MCLMALRLLMVVEFRNKQTSCLRSLLRIRYVKAVRLNVGPISDAGYPDPAIGLLRLTVVARYYISGPHVWNENIGRSARAQ